jgi:hypothetical protein
MFNNVRNAYKHVDICNVECRLIARQCSLITDSSINKTDIYIGNILIHASLFMRKIRCLLIYYIPIKQHILLCPL